MSFTYEVLRELTKELSGKRGSPAVRAQLTTLLVSIAAVTVGMSTMFFERSTLQNKTYQDQIQSLNETERDLRQLVDFVEGQKEKLAESEAVVVSLKEEESKLRPMVEANRELVDTILEAQQARSRAHIWKDRTISFLFGVIASIVGALILTAISKTRHARRARASRTTA